MKTTSSSVVVFAAVMATSAIAADYMGCYVDTGKPRSMVYLGYQGNDTSVKSCAQTCSSQGFPYSGTEYGGYCDNEIPTQGIAPEAECNRTCKGDAGSMCGGDFRLSLYKDQTLLPVSYSSNYGNFKYLGCYVDPLEPRILPQLQQEGPGNTINTCLDSCKNNGYQLAGLEYSGECWCGYTIPNVMVSDKECYRHCVGNVSQSCGAPARLSVYQSGARGGLKGSMIGLGVVVSGVVAGLAAFVL
ncbi:hypothetical protein HDU76_013810 [Blyttiomyces sp. JEL0837]|nr:hypothetical protein HDU76_013810 [Blyttiomyces sp. JEL0837]